MKALSVSKGDVISMETWAYYEAGSGFTPIIDETAFINALSSGFTQLISESVTALSTAFTEALGVVGLGGTGNDGIPAAYLNYLYFDKELNYISSGFEQVTSAASGSLEKLTVAPLTADQDGYIFVYVSNESNSLNYVHFDELKVSHQQAGILQYDDYYPFGLTFNSYTSGTENLYKYNGKEEQKETGWYDYGARMHDPWLGRFFTQDRLQRNIMKAIPTTMY